MGEGRGAYRVLVEGTEGKKKKKPLEDLSIGGRITLR
jgi:hypothetical protein